MRKEENRVYKIVRKNKRRRAAYAIRSVMVIALVLLITGFAGLKLSAISINAKGPLDGNYEKTYKSVMVEQDDCLWDIAERYMGAGYSDTRTYVSEVRKINNLNSDNLHYGDYICVPYYQ